MASQVTTNRTRSSNNNHKFLLEMAAVAIIMGIKPNRMEINRTSNNINSSSSSSNHRNNHRNNQSHMAMKLKRGIPLHTTVKVEAMRVDSIGGNKVNNSAWTR
jgi:hypothetical protein